MAVKKSKRRRAAQWVAKAPKKVADQVLARVSPQLQSKVDGLIKRLESSREGKLGDLTLLAGKILERAQVISKSLKPRRMKKGPVVQ